MVVTPALERMMVEDQEFKANVGHTVRETPNNRVSNFCRNFTTLP